MGEFKLETFAESPNEAVLKYVMNMIPYSVFWQDTQCRFLGCNDAFARSAKYQDASQVIGKTVFEMNLPHELAKRLIEDNMQVMRMGQPIVDQEEHLPGEDDQLKVILTSKIPMRDHAGNVSGIIVIFRDVTDRKRVERELLVAKANADHALSEMKRMHEELRTSQASMLQTAKMASLGVMASGLAHEINNPLAIIKGNSEALLFGLEMGTVDPTTVTQRSATITRTVDRIAKIIQGLRVYARDSSGDVIETVQYQKLVDETLAFCSAKFRNHGIVLSTQVAADLPKTQARVVQLSQVILNLLNNAYDAIDGLDEKWIRIDVRSWEGGVELSITDSGHKIPPQISSRMTEPFFTTKEVGKGTGLGLSVSQGILQSHGGRLYLDLQHPHTRMAIWLPEVK